MERDEAHDLLLGPVPIVPIATVLDECAMSAVTRHDRRHT
jgi:hypothetical protein